MNIDKYNSNKSDPRIAHDNYSPPLSSSSHTFTSNMINNLTDNNKTTGPNNNHNNGPENSNSPSGFTPSTPLNNAQINAPNKFTKATSSPSLDDTSHTISIASLNIRGFTSNVFKFDAII